jgi:hypothetical protein
MQEGEGKAPLSLVRGQTWTCLVQASGSVFHRSRERKASTGSPRPLRLALSDHASDRTIQRCRSQRWRVKSSRRRSPFSFAYYQHVATETCFALKGGTAIRSRLDETSKLFLRSFHTLRLDWDLINSPIIRTLPAIRWKLMNLERLQTENPGKYQTMLQELDAALS